MHTLEKLIIIGQARLTYWPLSRSVKSLTLALNLEMIFWCKLIFDCLIFIEFWHQTEPGLTERRWEMTKHQLECIRQPRQRPQPPTVTSETSQGGGGHTQPIRGRARGTQPIRRRTTALIESSVILINLSRQIHNQMLCAMFNWMTLWMNTRRGGTVQVYILFGLSCKRANLRKSSGAIKQK